ncbi:MAG: SET domain-containing protein-lysine N-methyltransferase [Anaerolineae bacterium]|nr:SET domain-containing protein-lysine N-methyltransferase [Anaerolineae bacterium]
MLDEPTCYLSPKLEGRERADGSYGVYAHQPVLAQETLVVWGGEVVPGDKLDQLPPDIRRYTLQIEEDLYLVTVNVGPADWINHSCRPNAGLNGQVVLVALRDIAPGEQICYDYATSDGSPYDEFNCQCGAPNCRGRVTGNDWSLPELQTKYAGYFSPYLQRRIHQLEKTVHTNGYHKSTGLS